MIKKVRSEEEVKFLNFGGGEFERILDLCRGLKVVKSCFQGHFLFTCSESTDTFAVGCIV